MDSYYNWWTAKSKQLVTEISDNDKKPNYCQRGKGGQKMSRCTVPKHKKTDSKVIFECCLYFQPREGSTAECLFYRNGKSWNHHCDCVTAQYEK